MSVLNFPFYGNAIYGAAANLPTGVPDGTLAVVLDTYSLMVYKASTTSWMNIQEAGGAVTFANGTAAAPSINFTQALTSGLYSQGANAVAISTNGAAALTISSAQVVNIPGALTGSTASFSGNIDITGSSYIGTGNGANTQPSFTFHNELTAGLYRSAGSSNIQFATGNTNAGSIDASQNWNIVGRLTTAGITNSAQMSNLAGSVSAPSYAITGSLGTGMWSSGANVLDFSSNGAQVLRLSSAGSIVCNAAAIATNATDGFLYVPTCAGAPSGTPTTFTGRVPIVFDSSDGRLYAYYGGAWKYQSVAT